MLLQPEPSEVARFKEEVRALSRVRDPGVVQILDADQDGEGRLFLVMELVPGETLAARIARGPLEPREVATLGLEIARILEHLHGLGVVHRDLKPANVMIRPDGRPVLLDLGLALLLDRSARLSRAGEVIGTPAFMSPEQAQGRVKDMGPAADVYGLGATLFALLTGRAPFEAHDALGMIEAVIAAAPPAPSRLRAGLGQGLDRIVLACLAKDPLSRPELRQVRAALLAAQRGGAAPARRPAALAAGAAVALLALLAGSLAAALALRLPEDAPPVAVAPPAPASAPDPPPPPELETEPPPGDPAGDLRAAQAGDPAAMVRVGDRLRRAGPDRDVPQALEWYRRAAGAGSTDALIMLGNAAWEGDGQPPDPAAAERWYRQAADAGSVEGMACLGSLYLARQDTPGDRAQAERWLEVAAARGNGRALCNLAILREEGAPDLPADQTGALDLYRRAAEAGWSQAALILANRYAQGRGVPKSEQESARWLRIAAEAGNTQAACRLAMLLRRGEGVPRDLTASARWLAKAVSAGDLSGAYWLGVLFYDGAGVPRDLRRAQLLFQRAEGRTRDYAPLYLYLCALERGDEAGGLAALRAAREQVGGGTGPIVEVLLGERAEEELLAPGVTPPDGLSPAQLRCLASFYLGARRVLEGDRTRGEELLRACVATGVVDYPQHGSACAWLERLGAR